jgi:hypothetical protein
LFLFLVVVVVGGDGGRAVYYQTHMELTNKTCGENTRLGIPPDPNV